MKQFYDHIIEIDSLIIELDQLSLKPQEKEHLIAIIKTNVHTIILDVILSELPEKDKKMFLAHVYHDNHDHIWKFLRARIENVEEKMILATKKLKEEFHNDIRVLKKKKK